MSDTRIRPIVHARLGIAEDNSGKLVTLTRQQARDLARKKSLSLVLTDGPPDLACPVIASIAGAYRALIVAEPTLSGHHNMDKVVELANHLEIPAYVCINKYDLNWNMTDTIEKYARNKGCSIAGRIPFNPSFIEAMVQNRPLWSMIIDVMRHRR